MTVAGWGDRNFIKQTNLGFVIQVTVLLQVILVITTGDTLSINKVCEYSLHFDFFYSIKKKLKINVKNTLLTVVKPGEATSSTTPGCILHLLLLHLASTTQHQDSFTLSLIYLITSQRLGLNRPVTLC